MASCDPAVPWTDEQWARVTQTVQKEAARSRVAATFLPLVGPLPPDTDFVRKEKLEYRPPSRVPTPPPESQRMAVDDRDVIQLATPQVKVFLRGGQVADPNLTSALEMFRRAANVLARLEDAIVFRGQKDRNEGPPDQAITGLPGIWKVTGGMTSPGLLDVAQREYPNIDAPTRGAALVQAVSAKIGELERRGHFGPFAVVLGQDLFLDAQSPANSLVLPSDRILPFLGGGPLLRSSTLPEDQGIVVALGAAPIELVIANDVSVKFLQVTTDPRYVFRVFEKMALRIKEDHAVEWLKRQGGIYTGKGGAPATAPESGAGTTGTGPSSAGTGGGSPESGADATGTGGGSPGSGAGTAGTGPSSTGTGDGSPESGAGSTGTGHASTGTGGGSPESGTGATGTKPPAKSG